MQAESIRMVWMVLCHLLNFSDAVLTLYAVSKGVEEANPTMAWALTISPALFILLKFAVFSIAIEFIAKVRPALLGPVGILYMSVVAWHLSFWMFGIS